MAGDEVSSVAYFEVGGVGVDSGDDQ